jgi:hypothetical protein
MQNAQGNYRAFRTALPTSLNDLREATAGDVGAIAANGGLLASDTTPALSGTSTTLAQQVSWVAGNVDPVLLHRTLPDDFDGRDDVLVELWVNSGTTNPADFSVLSSWDGGATVTDTAADTTTLSATTHKISTKIAAADIPDSPANLSLALVPAAHATDAITLTGYRISYFARAIER